MLLNFIKIINKNLPSFVYIPSDIYSKSLNTKQTVLRICEDFSFCFFSKERVPFHLLIEIFETDEEILTSSRDSHHSNSKSYNGKKILKHEENKLILQEFKEE